MTKLESDAYNQFINTVNDQVKHLPLIGLIFINKLVSSELMERFNAIAEEAMQGKRS